MNRYDQSFCCSRTASLRSGAPWSDDRRRASSWPLLRRRRVDEEEEEEEEEEAEEEEAGGVFVLKDGEPMLVLSSSRSPGGWEKEKEKRQGSETGRVSEDSDGY